MQRLAELQVAMKKTRIVAESGMLSALSTVILLFGSIIDVLDLTSAVISGFCVIAMRIRHGRVGAVAVYCTSAVLAFLLLPNKIPAVLYIFYGGLYPLLKPEIERIPYLALQWILKVLSVLAFFSLGLLVITFVLGLDSGFTVGVPLYALLTVVAVCADISVSAMIKRFSHIVASKKR